MGSRRYRMDIEIRVDEYLAMEDRPAVTYNFEKVEAVIVDQHTPYDEYYIRTERASYPVRAGTILEVDYNVMVDDILNNEEINERALIIRAEEVRGVEFIRGERSFMMAVTSEGMRAIVRRRNGSLPPMWKEA